MQPEETDDVNDGLIVQNEQWGLVKNPEPGNCLVLYMVWLPEGDMPNDIELACKKLAKEAGYFPGFKFEFATTPSPGFIIAVDKGWEPSNTHQFMELLSRIVWELNRIVRS